RYMVSPGDYRDFPAEAIRHSCRYLRDRWRCRVSGKDGDGAGGAAVAAADLQREADEGEAPADQEVEVGEVLVAGDVVGPAHHVARVGLARRVVGGGAVHAERLDPAVHDPLAAGLAKAREVGEVAALARVPAVRAG